jgi:hypothetical protein
MQAEQIKQHFAQIAMVAGITLVDCGRVAR